MSPMPAGGGTKARARQEAQRARILEAARKCFSEQGFHGAGMSAIAKEAGMSQGLIYRYFTNKAAIIQAITEEQRARRTEDLCAIATFDDLVERLMGKLRRWRAGDLQDDIFDPALFLEISAESSRDPEVAAMVSEQEKEIWADFAAIVRRDAESRGQALDDEALRCRTMALRCLVDGVITACVRDPRLDCDQVQASLRRVLRQLGGG